MNRVQSRIRPRAALAAVIAVLLAGMVLLSDRASLLLGAARQRYDTPGWFPWSLDNGTLHFGLWLVVTLLATLAVRSVVARLVVGLAAVITASALEYLQARLTFTRRFELADLAANSRGVYAGLAIGLVAGAVIDRIERRRA